MQPWKQPVIIWLVIPYLGRKALVERNEIHFACPSEFPRKINVTRRVTLRQGKGYCSASWRQLDVSTSTVGNSGLRSWEDGVHLLEQT